MVTCTERVPSDFRGSGNVVRVISHWRAVSTRGKRKIHTFYLENLNKKISFGYLDANERILLKLVLKLYDAMLWFEFSSLRF
jgi:hypothetical protein